MKISKLILFIATTLQLSACLYAQNGDRFDISKASQLQPGVSTEADAIRLLGDPVARKADETGNNEKLMWFYSYGTAVAVGGSSKLVILFDGDGKMIKILEKSHT